MSFLEAVINYIQTAGIATFGQDMFEGDFPTKSPDRCMIVLLGTGTPPDGNLPIRHPAVQVITRGVDFPEAHNLIEQVCKLFHGDPPPKHNYQVGNYRVLVSKALQEPGDIGRDEKGRKMLSCNFGFTLRGGDNP